MTTDTFPRQYARTRRFTLGEPRDLRVNPEHTTVFFARSRSGSDPVTCLWACDTNSGHERLVVDPSNLNSGSGLSAAERAVRERLRESAEGITGYDTDATCSTAVFTVSGRTFHVDLASGDTTEIDIGDGAFDPRLSTDGTRLAAVVGPSFRVIALKKPHSPLLELTAESSEDLWGVAEFIAAEEMGRMRGFWWSPDSTKILVSRVDNSNVSEWSLSDPAQPWVPPRTTRYPAAGTTNASVSLHIADLASGDLIEVVWDNVRFEYLARVSWDAFGPLVTVQSRDQRSLEVLRVDPTNGSTTSIWRDEDDCWVEL
ncbi:MAG: DPP IV N-terminal domain-containing protein, partial [Ilumatobacteraceae bacterium]